jgi:hypothetical protein
MIPDSNTDFGFMSALVETKAEKRFSTGQHPAGDPPFVWTGVQVRVFLTQRVDSWDVVVPNGITTHGQFRTEPLSDPREVTGPRGLVGLL